MLDWLYVNREILVPLCFGVLGILCDIHRGLKP